MTFPPSLLTRARAAARPEVTGSVTGAMGLTLSVDGITAAVGDLVEVDPCHRSLLAEVVAGQPTDRAALAQGDALPAGVVVGRDDAAGDVFLVMVADIERLVDSNRLQDAIAIAIVGEACHHAADRIGHHAQAVLQVPLLRIGDVPTHPQDLVAVQVVARPVAGRGADDGKGLVERGRRRVVHHTRAIAEHERQIVEVGEAGGGQTVVIRLPGRPQGAGNDIAYAVVAIGRVVLAVANCIRQRRQQPVTGVVDESLDLVAVERAGEGGNVASLVVLVAHVQRPERRTATARPGRASHEVLPASFLRCAVYHAINSSFESYMTLRLRQAARYRPGVVMGTSMALSRQR